MYARCEWPTRMMACLPTSVLFADDVIALRYHRTARCILDRLPDRSAEHFCIKYSQIPIIVRLSKAGFSVKPVLQHDDDDARDGALERPPRRSLSHSRLSPTNSSTCLLGLECTCACRPTRQQLTCCRRGGHTYLQHYISLPSLLYIRSLLLTGPCMPSPSRLG